MTWVLFGVLLYIVAQLAIGAIVSRRIATEEDYLVAGRRLGPWLATASIFATWFGAETCVGAAGRAYEEGISANTADPFGYALCLILMGALFAVPLWKRKLTTIADLFRVRYSGGVERLAAILLIPTSVMWAAAQIHAFGQVLSSASDMQVETAIGIATAVVIVYTVSGGLWADAVTDIVQGAALILGLAIMAGAVVAKSGGLGPALDSIDPEKLRPVLGGAPFWQIVEDWSIPVCGSLFAQELIARVSASRSVRVARNATLGAGGIYLAVGLIPVFMGLVGASLLPGLESGEQVLPRLALDQLGPVIFVFFAGALVSAILSTVDSALLVASSLASHNLLVPLRPGMSERAKVRAARIGVAVFGLCAYWLALRAEGVYAMVEQASALGSSGVFVIVVFGLFTRFGGPWAAAAALVVGLLVYLWGEFGGALAHPYITSLAAALGAFVLIGWIERLSSRRTVEA